VIRSSSGLPVGLILGAAVWLLSAPITGHREPWDDPGVYYGVALFVAGTLGGLLVPRHWLEVIVGMFVGQSLVMLGGVMAEPTSGGLWPLGIMFIGVYTTVAMLGTALGSRIRRARGTRTRANH
jgi:hypothetical protein